MKCSLGMSNFLEEMSSLPHCVVSLYFFALITEEVILISPCGTSLVVQWLGIHTSIAGSTGSIPGQGTKIPHALWCSQKISKNKNKIISPCYSLELCIQMDVSLFFSFAFCFSSSHSYF